MKMHLSKNNFALSLRLPTLIQLHPMERQEINNKTTSAPRGSATNKGRDRTRYDELPACFNLALPAYLPSAKATFLEAAGYLEVASPLISSTSKNQSLSHMRFPHADCDDRLVLIEMRE
jgi:hypothetical protein